jgi:hypothetical protein
MDADEVYVHVYNRAMFVLVGAGFTIGLVLLARQDSNWLYLVGAAVAGAFAVRALFWGRVTVSTERFRYRGFFGTLSLSWDQILRFRVDEMRGSEGGRVAVLVLVDRDDDAREGRAHWLYSLCWPARRPAEADRVMHWLNGYIDAYRRRGR